MDTIKYAPFDNIFTMTHFLGTQALIGAVYPVYEITPHNWPEFGDEETTEAALIFVLNCCLSVHRKQLDQAGSHQYTLRTLYTIH